MKIKIERSEKIKKEKPVLKVGTHKKTTILLWMILLASIIFGVYKNFTAIDSHTIHEKEVIEQKLVDTNKIESFVREFATGYFSWQHSQASMDKRTEWLKNYLTEELQQLNLEMVRADIPTTSSVTQIQFWNIEAKDKETYQVVFSVEQLITEKENKKVVSSTYHVLVHIDEVGDLVIIQNPTIASKPKKSNYAPKQLDSDGTVDAMTMEEVTNFLETFFKLYPKATEEELTYYISDNALPVISKDYIFVELMNPIYMDKENQVSVTLSVKYLDQETKITQISQYELI
ncbi:conjugal transfer protein, partial [Listeria monocytogenes]|nr:conjugal transfer protein [Listeria monocytogenes]